MTRGRVAIFSREEMLEVGRGERRESSGLLGCPCGITNVEMRMECTSNKSNENQNIIYITQQIATI